ncbi:FtsB family cell division protein [Maritalea mediterranea]|uniref:Septum formation initiator family protein n=1 Tax=Maritalea mediterranea TaxID=2909667 RepID=A0ABS9E8K9_9HYPH|nr:septum formation initiator family protein [Maritalea mediterranea]MCF4098529.1 septum formation initiator family protein [Maritalea mediterranea]
MPTRLKKPSIANKLLITAALLAFQGYLAHHALNGQYGVESQKQLVERKATLMAQNEALEAQIERAKNRNSLLVADRLDPDMLSERARGLLGWSNPDDILIAIEKE